MTFFRRLKSEDSKPQESFQITESLSCAVWTALGANGKKRIHWKLSRISPESGDCYTLMKIEQLLEFPQALAILCAGFSKVTELDANLRDDLEKLERLMSEADAQLRSNGELNEETDADQGIFSR